MTKALPPPGTRVHVYRNLNRKAWSVRVGGVVVAHVASIELTNCECRVSEAGRDKVRSSGRRSVHAYVVGTLVGTAPRRSSAFARFTYNPHRDDMFVSEHGPVHRADRMVFDTAGGAWYKETT